MVKVGDKVKFTQANSPFAQAQTFDATILSIDENNVASLALELPSGSVANVDGIALKSDADTGDFPVWYQD